jgi:hypothetical protein
MRKKNPVISNTGKFICFNKDVYTSLVSIIMYLTCTIIVLLKKYIVDYMAYIFTLLMFRKSNKTTINKNKTTHFYRSTSFRFSFIFRYFKIFQVKNRLYLDISRSFKWKESFIFRYFKVFQVSQIFTCGLSDLLLLAVGSLVVTILRE